MSLLQGASELNPVGRNHYREDGYFRLNVKNGVLRSREGTRMLTLPEDLIVGLHRGLEDETGAAAPIVLYSIGRWWGRQFARQHEGEIRRFYRRDIGDLPLAFYLQVLRRVWGLFGWGQLDLSFDLQERGFIEALVDGALYSESIGNIGRTSDHLVAGVLASLVSALSGRDLEAVEIACKSQGDPQCRFLIGLSSRTAVISNWVTQKRKADEILESVRDGELA